jgi:hypothetical protein
VFVERRTSTSQAFRLFDPLGEERAPGFKLSHNA